MTSDDRKSSDDLIRDARRRIEDPRPDPNPVRVDSHPPYASELSEPAETPTRPIEEPESLEQPDVASPAKPSRPGRFGTSLVVRLILAAVIAGGWWFFTSLDDANRDDNGAIVSSGDLAVTDMQPGDCFNDPDAIEDEAVDVAAVPCSEPHDNEVFATLSLAAAFDEFPGVATLEQYTYETCISPFSGYVGTDYATSSLEVFTFFPTNEGWNQGDRGFVCVLYALDFSKLTGSARDSEL